MRLHCQRPEYLVYRAIAVDGKISRVLHEQYQNSRTPSFQSFEHTMILEPDGGFVRCWKAC